MIRTGFRTVPFLYPQSVPASSIACKGVEDDLQCEGAVLKGELGLYLSVQGIQAQ